MKSFKIGDKPVVAHHPAASLKQARSERDLARRTLQSGSDPSKRRQIERLELQLAEANTFEEVARELHATKASGWSKQYGERWLERMEKDLFPWIGPVRLPEITAPRLLNTLHKIEKRGARETAHTLRVALRRMGYSNDDMTPHGFRAMARTIMVERLNMQPDVIEAQLAHGKSGPLGSADDRAEFMEQRRKMMDEWANYLERLHTGVNAPAKRMPTRRAA